MNERTKAFAAMEDAAAEHRFRRRPRPVAWRVLCLGVAVLAVVGAGAPVAARTERTDDGKRWTIWRWPWRSATSSETSTIFLPEAEEKARRDQVREEKQETGMWMREREKIIIRRKAELRQDREARLEAATGASSAIKRTSPPTAATASTTPDVEDTATGPTFQEIVGAAASSTQETWDEVREAAAGVVEDIRDRFVKPVVSEVAAMTSPRARSTWQVMLLLLAALPIPCLMVACMTVGFIQWRRSRPVQGFAFLVAGGTVAGLLYLIVAGG